MLSSGSLTSSPVSIFWLTLGILVLTAVLIAIAVVTWRSDNSRKKIRLTIASRSQILSTPASLRDDLQITYKDERIQGDLYVTALELTNVGRLSIKSTDFDAERSAHFALDTKIIKHLSTEHSPNSAPAPKITANENIFSLEPELIVKGEGIKLALLTEGRPTRLETAFSPFGEVGIEIEDREQQASKRSRLTRRVTKVLAIILVLALAVNIYGLISALKAESNADNADNAANTYITYAQCAALSQGLVTTNNDLVAVEIQTAALQGNQIGPEVLVPYDSLLYATQAELYTLGDDYNNLAVIGKPDATYDRMYSLIEKTVTVVIDMVKTNINASERKLANQLPSIQKALFASSAKPNECNA